MRSHIEPNRILMTSLGVGCCRKMDKITKVWCCLQSFRFDYSAENYRRVVSDLQATLDESVWISMSIASGTIVWSVFWRRWARMFLNASNASCYKWQIQVLNHLLTRKHLKCEHRFGNLWHQFTPKWFFCCSIQASFKLNGKCAHTMQFCNAINLSYPLTDVHIHLTGNRY